jgi:hypothetical protein
VQMMPTRKCALMSSTPHTLVCVYKMTRGDEDVAHSHQLV